MKLISSSSVLCLLLIPSLVVSPLDAQSAATPPPPISREVTVPGGQAGPLDNTDLQLRVTEGAAPVAKANSIPAKSLTVAVTNASGVAIADAAVALRLPDSGPTGTFADGSHSAVTYTDSNGRASFSGLHWNQTPGSVAVRITATKGNSHAALLLNETLTSDVETVVQVPPPIAQSTPPITQPAQTAKTQPLIRSVAISPVVTPSAPPAVPAMTPAIAPKVEPRVSVSGGSPAASSGHSGKTKWIILAVVIAGGAGGAMAFVGKGKSSPTTATPGLSIGTPSVSVGAP
jgi:hypothetical protein